MKKLSLFAAMFFFAMALYAQDVTSSNLSWSVTQLDNLSTAKSLTYACVFETHRTKDISWKQNGGYTMSFDIKKVDGSWPDVNTTGQLAYTISAEGETGTLTFERTPEGIFIKLNISQGSADRLRHRYSVSQVTQSNQ